MSGVKGRSGIYKRTKPVWNKGKSTKNIPQMGFQKGHFSYHTKTSKGKISKALKLAYRKGERTCYFKGKVPWNKRTHIKLNDALERYHKKGVYLTGKDHWRWIEDRSILIKNERNDPEYKQWVKKVKKRDHNICQLRDKNCKGYKIAHHIKSWARYPELRYIVSNGITLCQAHHPKRRAEEKRLESILLTLVSVLSEKLCQDVR